MFRFLATLIFMFPTTLLAEESKVSIPQLIKELGDKDHGVRSRAHTYLLKIGTPARKKLEAALLSKDPEVKLRAEKLLDQLKLEKVWASSRVTLKTNEKASEILLKLAEQSNNHIHVGYAPYGSFKDEKLDVNYDKTIYWEAVDDICHRTGNKMRPHYDINTPGVAINEGSPGNYPRAYSGPVRALIISSKRKFIEELHHEEGDSQLEHAFHMNLQFSWEDRFQMVGYSTQPEFVEGVTDNHVKISAYSGRSGWNAVSRGLRQVTATMNFHPIPVSAKYIERFTIRWKLIATADPAVIEISPVESEQVFSQDDVKVRIKSLEKESPGRFIVTLLVSRDLATPNPYKILFNEFQVEAIDQKPRPFRVFSKQAPALTDRGVQLIVTLQGNNDSELKMLKLHYPRQRSRRDVELTFRNVPLPVARPE